MVFISLTVSISLTWVGGGCPIVPSEEAFANGAGKSAARPLGKLGLSPWAGRGWCGFSQDAIARAARRVLAPLAQPPTMLTLADKILLAWLALANLWAFLLFGWDKWRACRSGWRVSEWHLVLAGACGGWPGGWLGMLAFRHKTAKLSFKLKYAAGLLACAAWCAIYWRLR